MTFLRNAFIVIGCLATISLLILNYPIKENPTDIFLRKAENLKNLGDFVGAENTYLKVVTLDAQARPPHLYQLAALLGLANCYLMDQKYSMAISTCDDVLKVSQVIYGPDDNLNTNILFTLASAQESLEKYDDAKTTYEKIIAIVKKSTNLKIAKVVPMIKLGDIELKRKHLSLAIKLYKEAYAMRPLPSPLDNLLSYRLALSCMALGENQQANLYFQNCLPVPVGTEHLFAHVMSMYSQFLKENEKYGKASTVESLAREGNNKHADYCKWISKKASPNSRYKLQAKFIDRDITMIEALSHK